MATSPGLNKCPKYLQGSKGFSINTEKDLHSNQFCVALL